MEASSTGTETALRQTLEDIEQQIQRREYSRASSNLLVVFGNSRPEGVYKKAYATLIAIILELNSKEIEQVERKAFKPFLIFPKLHEEQMELAVCLGSWHFKNIALSTHQRAMNFFSKAICIAERYQPHRKREAHLLASRLFFQFISDQIVPSHPQIKRLRRALGNPELFYSILEGIRKQIIDLKPLVHTQEGFAIIRGLYEKARDVYNSIGEDRQEKYAPSSDLLMEISSETSSSHHVSEYCTERYRRAIREYRDNFRERFRKFTSEISDFSKVRELQESIQKDFIRFFSEVFLKDAFAFLGTPPCSFDFRAMGSIGRGEICPFSDLEWMILIEDMNGLDYFKKLAYIVERQVASLGETAGGPPVFSCLGDHNPSGFHLDSGGNPAQEDLIRTPEGMAQSQVARDGELENTDPCKVEHSLRKSCSLLNSDTALFEAYEAEMKRVLSQVFSEEEQVPLGETIGKKRALGLLRKRLQEYQKCFHTPLDNQESLNIKEQFVQFINYCLNDLALYCNICEVNTLDIIDALVQRQVFTERSGRLLKEVVAAVYMIRIRLHFSYGEQKEEACLQSESPLNEEEVYHLKRAYWFVLHPLYRFFLATSNDVEENPFRQIDLLDRTFPKKIEHCDSSREKVRFLASATRFFSDEFTDLSIRHFMQLLKAHYVAHWGELTLPFASKTVSIREFYTQLVLIESHRKEESELVESLTSKEEQPEVDSLRETFNRMQQGHAPLSLMSLFDSRGSVPSPKNVLLLGRAGIGKSTLCQKIVHDWASGRLWQDRFSAIFWIPLRFLNEMRELSLEPDKFLAAAAAHLLEPSATEVMVRHIKEEGERLLIILDGYDEATEEFAKTIDSILSGSLYHILITSRPGVTARLRPHMDMIIENMGFSDEQISNYVLQFFHREGTGVHLEKREKTFLQALKRDTNLFALSHIPLLLQMLCGLWERGIEAHGFTTNLFSLYHEIVDQLFEWQYQRQGKDLSTVSLSQKEALFTLLGEIALRGLARGKLIFRDTLLEESLSGSKITRQDLMDSGLIKATEKNDERYYHFLHLSLQEYLIAYTISRSAIIHQNSFILENRYKPQYQLVMVLLAGALHQLDSSVEKRQLKRFFQKLHESVDSVSDEYRLEVSLKCLNECHDYEGPIAGMEELIKVNPLLLQKELCCHLPSFHYSVAHGNIPAMKWLIKQDSSLYKKPIAGGVTPFHTAAKYGQVAAMEWLDRIDLANPQGRNDTLGSVAVGVMYEFMVSDRGKLDHEIRRQNMERERRLYFTADSDGLTPFHYAAAHGQISAMEWMYEQDKHLYFKSDKTDRTPFHVAAANGQIEVMEWLYRAIPSWLGDQGASFRRLLAKDSHPEARKWMLKKDPKYFESGCIIS